MTETTHGISRPDPHQTGKMRALRTKIPRRLTPVAVCLLPITQRPPPHLPVLCPEP